MPPVTNARTKSAGVPSTLTSSPPYGEETEQALRNANDYLLCSVGDLLYVGAPETRPQGGWLFPVLFGTHGLGELGRVGTIAVSADGNVERFTPSERTEVQNRARLLASRSSA